MLWKPNPSIYRQEDWGEAIVMISKEAAVTLMSQEGGGVDIAQSVCAQTQLQSGLFLSWSTVVS